MDYVFIVLLCVFGAGLCLGYVMRAIAVPAQPRPPSPLPYAIPTAKRPSAPLPVAPKAPDWHDHDWRHRLGDDEIEHISARWPSPTPPKSYIHF